jgi:hypothetical protein
MKGYFEKFNTTRTETLLAKHGLKLDKYDGVISLVGKDSTGTVGTVLTISFREVLTKVTVYENRMHFDFKTTNGSCFPKKKHLKIMSAEEWFELIEVVATSLALEVGINELNVWTGIKDKKFILSKGYEKKKDNFYHKKIDPTILLNVV